MRSFTHASTRDRNPGVEHRPDLFNMRILKGRVATTQADRQGEQAVANALIGMAEAINAHYIPFMTQHDPRLPPVGRIVDAHVEEIGGGHFALVAAVELWDATDL